LLVEIASSFIGSVAVKYLFGHSELGQSPECGFDCSGFIRFVLNKSGLALPDYIDINGNQSPIRHANEFWDHYGVSVHHGLHQPGDLIFFSRNGYFPSHIGLVRDAESYIHSPGKNGTKVCVAEIKEEEIPADDTLARIMFQKNPIGYKSPTVPLNAGNYRYVQRCL